MAEELFPSPLVSAGKACRSVFHSYLKSFHFSSSFSASWLKIFMPVILRSQSIEWHHLERAQSSDLTNSWQDHQIWELLAVTLLKRAQKESLTLNVTDRKLKTRDSVGKFMPLSILVFAMVKTGWHKQVFATCWQKNGKTNGRWVFAAYGFFVALS